MQNTQNLYLNHSNVSYQPLNPEDYHNQSRKSMSNSRVRREDANYPFGKESIRIANYVSEQMKGDEENKRILEKFRIDAIKHRNQRVMKHLGRIPYITESMLPGSNIDPSLFMDRPPQRQILDPPPQLYVPMNMGEMRKNTPAPSFPHLINRTEPAVKILEPRSKATKKQMGVQVDFEREFPLMKKKREHRKKYYTIENYEQEVAFDKITTMLHHINDKLNFNSKMLNDSLVREKKISTPRKETGRRQRAVPKFYTEDREMSEAPTIEYTSNFKRNKSSKEAKTSSIHEHLKLLKSKKRRLDDLDGYVEIYTRKQ